MIFTVRTGVILLGVLCDLYCEDCVIFTGSCVIFTVRTGVILL